MDWLTICLLVAIAALSILAIWQDNKIVQQEGYIDRVRNARSLAVEDLLSYVRSQSQPRAKPKTVEQLCYCGSGRMDDATAEQISRDLLERMEIPGAQEFSAGELVELSNFINGTPHGFWNAALHDRVVKIEAAFDRIKRVCDAEDLTQDKKLNLIYGEIIRRKWR